MFVQNWLISIEIKRRGKIVYIARPRKIPNKAVTIPSKDYAKLLNRRDLPYEINTGYRNDIRWEIHKA